jgi:hypothetical protein
MKMLREERDGVEAKLSRVQQENAKVRSRELELRQEIDGLRHELLLKSDSSEVDSLKKLVNELQTTTAQQSDQLDAAHAHEAMLCEENASLLQERDGLQHSLEDALLNVAKATLEMQEAKDKNNRLKIMSSEYESSLEQSNQRVLDLQLQLISQREESDGQVEQQSAQIESLERAVLALRQELKDGKEKQREGKLAMRAMKQQVEAMQAHAQEAVAMLEAKESQLAEAEARVEDAQAEIAALKSFLISTMSSTAPTAESGAQPAAASVLATLPTLNLVRSTTASPKVSTSKNKNRRISRANLDMIAESLNNAAITALETDEAEIQQKIDTVRKLGVQLDATSNNSSNEQTVKTSRSRVSSVLSLIDTSTSGNPPTSSRRPSIIIAAGAGVKEGSRPVTTRYASRSNSPKILLTTSSVSRRSSPLAHNIHTIAKIFEQLNTADEPPSSSNQPELDTNKSDGSKESQMRIEEDDSSSTVAVAANDDGDVGASPTTTSKATKTRKRLKRMINPTATTSPTAIVSKDETPSTPSFDSNVGDPAAAIERSTLSVDSGSATIFDHQAAAVAGAKDVLSTTSANPSSLTVDGPSNSQVVDDRKVTSSVLPSTAQVNPASSDGSPINSKHGNNKRSPKSTTKADKSTPQAVNTMRRSSPRETTSSVEVDNSASIVNRDQAIEASSSQLQQQHLTLPSARSIEEQHDIDPITTTSASLLAVSDASDAVAEESSQHLALAASSPKQAAEAAEAPILVQKSAVQLMHVDADRYPVISAVEATIDDANSIVLASAAHNAEQLSTARASASAKSSTAATPTSAAANSTTAETEASKEDGNAVDVAAATVAIPSSNRTEGSKEKQSDRGDDTNPHANDYEDTGSAQLRPKQQDKINDEAEDGSASSTSPTIMRAKVEDANDSATTTISITANEEEEISTKTVAEPLVEPSASISSSSPRPQPHLTETASITNNSNSIDSASAARSNITTATIAAGAKSSINAARESSSSAVEINLARSNDQAPLASKPTSTSPRPVAPSSSSDTDQLVSSTSTSLAPLHPSESSALESSPTSQVIVETRQSPSRSDFSSQITTASGGVSVEVSSHGKKTAPSSPSRAKTPENVYHGPLRKRPSPVNSSKPSPPVSASVPQSVALSTSETMTTFTKLADSPVETNVEVELGDEDLNYGWNMEAVEKQQQSIDFNDSDSEIISRQPSQEHVNVTKILPPRILRDKSSSSSQRAVAADHVQSVSTASAKVLPKSISRKEVAVPALIRAQQSASSRSSSPQHVNHHHHRGTLSRDPSSSSSTALASSTRDDVKDFALRLSASPTKVSKPVWTTEVTAPALTSNAASNHQLVSSAEAENDAEDQHVSTLHNTNSSRRRSLAQSQHDPPVDLQPAASDAGVEELLLRNYLLATVMPVLGESAAHVAMNAAAPVIQRYATMLTSSLQALWSLLQANKRAMDFTVKANLVFEAIVSARAAAASDATAPSSADIAQICAEIVPLAGSLVGTKLTPLWQAACQVDDEILSELIPRVDPRSGQLSFQPYATYFHLFDESCEDEIDAEAMNVQQAKETVDRIVAYQTNSLDNLNDLLLEVLMDWSATKAVVLNSDKRHDLNLIAMKQESERRQRDDQHRIESLEKHVETLSSQLQQSMTKLDEQQRVIEHVNSLEQHIHGQRNQTHSLI